MSTTSLSLNCVWCMTPLSWGSITQLWQGAKQKEHHANFFRGFGGHKTWGVRSAPPKTWGTQGVHLGCNKISLNLMTINLKLFCLVPQIPSALLALTSADCRGHRSHLVTKGDQAFASLQVELRHTKSPASLKSLLKTIFGNVWHCLRILFLFCWNCFYYLF